MIKARLKNLTTAGCFSLAAATLLTLANTPASASIIEPEVADLQPISTITETRQLLDRASFIAFQGASAVQQLQYLSMDDATSELLRNYMASMIYIPQAIALPSDAEVLDEPWLASTSGTVGTTEGLVVPNLDDEGASTESDEVEEAAPSSVQQFLKLLKPVQNAVISSPFGIRWGRPHQGIDMAAPTGTPIMSAENGKVVYSGWKQGYGNFVAVDHGHGYETHYAHCSKVLVHNGQKVKKGQVIAKVGSTGRSTGPHLHFEVLANGVHRNPAKFLNQTLTVVQAH